LCCYPAAVSYASCYKAHTHVVSTLLLLSLGQQAMELTEEQKAALQVCYGKVKPVTDALTAQHAALAARLAQLQSSQHSKQRAFEHGAQELYSWVHAAPASNAAAAAAAAASPAGGLSPQAALLARQAERAQQLKRQQQLQRQQQHLGAMQQQICNAPAAASPEGQGGLLQLGSGALQAKIASAADVDELALLLSQSLEEAGKSVMTNSGCATAATVADSISSPAGYVAAPTASTATGSGAKASPVLQDQQRQVHFAMPVQQQQQQQQQQQSLASPHSQSQSSADAAMQLQQSFWQQDAAAVAAAGWPSSAGFPTQPGTAAAAAAAAGGYTGSPGITANVGDNAACQYAVIESAVDTLLDLHPVMEQGFDSGTAAAAGVDGLCSSSGNARFPAGGAFAAAGGGSSDNTPLLVSSTPCANNSAAASPAAAATPNRPGLQMLSREEVAAAVLGAAQDTSSSSASQVLTSVIARSSSQCQRDLLMHVGSKEQQQIEQEMDRITAQLKMQQYCLALHLHNVCSKKQIALHYLHCFPFIPEAFSCEYCLIALCAVWYCTAALAPAAAAACYAAG
jgi:hypothetical protein